MPVGEIIGLGLGAVSNLAGVNQQQDMMNLQYLNQKQLNEQGHKLQKEMWDYTNYENQVKHMKNAGLNVGLMYGGSGGGGATTGSQGGGSATGGNAPVMELGQNLMQGAQLELIKAQAEKTRAEAENIAGVERENVATQTKDLLQGIENKKAQEVFTNIQNEISKVDAQIKNDTYEEQVEYIRGLTSYQGQQINQLRYSNAIDKATINEKVQTIKAELSGIILKNQLTKAQTDNTIQATEESINRVEQAWKKLILETAHLENEQKKVKIEEFKANLGSEYQGVSNVIGKMMNDFIGLTKPKENDELHRRVNE